MEVSGDTHPPHLSRTPSSLQGWAELLLWCGTLQLQSVLAGVSELQV